MDKHFTYKTSGVCASEINFDVIDGVLHNIDIVGGCAGNSAGVERLSEGMPIREVYKRCKGIPCHGELPARTSWPTPSSCAWRRWARRCKPPTIK